MTRGSITEDFEDENQNCQLESWIDKRTTSFSGGNGTEISPYEISSAEEFAYLAYKVNNGSMYAYKKYFILTKDIILNDGFFDEKGNYIDGGDGVLNTWAPIGINLGGSSFYQSIFDGQGHSISGLYINTETDKGGLFGIITYGSTIQNFKMENSYVYANEGGVACAGMYGKDNRIYNVINCGNACFVTSGGGVCGSTIQSSYIEDCINYGNINANKNAGGISVGHASYTQLSNCKNYGNISGGACGGVSFNAHEVDNCENNGNIVSGSPCGGVIGTITKTIRDCSNNGDINVTTASNVHNIGGIAGNLFSSKESSCSGCVNRGNITISGYNAGGIIGGTSVSNLIISNCKNYGNVGTANVVGGIVGSARINNLILSHCENYGEIKGKDYNCGGLVGAVDTAEISVCKNKGNIIADKVESVGAFVGRTTLAIKVSNCINYADVIKKKNVTSACFGLFEKGSTHKINGVISCGKLNGVLDKEYYGTNFSEFYLDLKSGEVGLKLFVGKGLFQGKVEENILQNKGYTKKTI